MSFLYIATGGYMFPSVLTKLDLRILRDSDAKTDFYVIL